MKPPCFPHGIAEPPAWLLRRVEHTASTNDLARSLAPWQAVMAREQSAGRGRHGRRFVSGAGGLWLSAVVPMPGGAAAWTGLALAVGWGILGWLRALAGQCPQGPLETARLRWPNDLMIGNRKLAGILLEQSSAEVCVVGVGLNLLNDPGTMDPDLAPLVVRLGDVLPDCPSPDAAVAGVLEGIARGWHRMALAGLAGMAEELNLAWGGMRWVEVRLLDGEPVSGWFQGIDHAGALVVRLPEGGGRVFPAHLVERMVEVEESCLGQGIP